MTNVVISGCYAVFSGGALHTEAAITLAPCSGILARQKSAPKEGSAWLRKWEGRKNPSNGMVGKIGRSLKFTPHNPSAQKPTCITQQNGISCCCTTILLAVGWSPLNRVHARFPESRHCPYQSSMPSRKTKGTQSMFPLKKAHPWSPLPYHGLIMVMQGCR